MWARAAVALALLLAAAPRAAAQEPERVVRQLQFEGNSAISDEVLASAISTTNSSWFARSFLVRWIGLGEKRYFDEQEFKRDVVRLDVLYRRSGYPNVEIDTLVRRTPENVSITFRIQEGNPIRVTNLTINGLDTIPPEVRRKVVQDLPLQEGDPFNRFLMSASADSVTRRLRDRGYPSARVFTAFETRKEALTATVTLDTDPGDSAVIGHVEVVGTNRIEPRLVRNLLISRPGRLYSQDELLQSQRNLYSSDLFRFATVNIDSAAFQPGMDSVPLVVQVSEAKRRRIRGGLGYGTDDCFRGSLGWTTRNFLGSGGRILDLTSRISKVGVGTPFDW
ncbi:MAG TPA: POTRA domain-containing protein, partial [Gemmatimonadales bacterium]